MPKEKTQCEMKDLTEMIYRFVAANNQNVCFVGSFMAFKPICDECLEKGADPVKDEASRMFAYGNKEALRALINELRDMIEDEADEEDFVSV